MSSVAENVAEVETEPRPNRLWSVAQTIVGLSALAYVLARADLNEAMLALTRLDLMVLAAATLLNLLMTFAMSMRWHWLLRVRHPEMRTLEVFRQYMVGLFFNLFAPSSVGGDIYRLMSVGKYVANHSYVLATLVIERFVGACGLMLAGLAGLLVGRAYLDDRSFFWSLAIMGTGLLFCVAPFSPQITGLLASALKRLDGRAQGRFSGAGHLVEHLAVFWQKRRLTLSCIAMTVLVRLLWGLSCWAVSVAMGFDIPFSVMLAFITIVDIARLTPISPPNGIGVREYLLVLLLGRLGIAQTEAVLFSLIAYTMLMLNGLLGGLIYTAGSIRRIRA